MCYYFAKKKKKIQETAVNNLANVACLSAWRTSKFLVGQVCWWWLLSFCLYEYVVFFSFTSKG